MAIFIKQRTTYLKDTSLWIIAIAMLIIVSVWGVNNMFFITFSPPHRNVFITLMIFFGVIGTIWIVVTLTKKLKIESDHYFQGYEGEQEIQTILKQLPDEYIIIPDIKKTKGGNIDFVVVGPTGIFALEVKNPSHATAIGFNGTALTFNGKPCKKDPLKQALRSATGLGKDLQKELNDPHIFVNAVVVFANHGFLHFGLKKVYKNARIIGKEFLIELLTLQQGSTFSPEKTEKIITTLSKLYNFPLPPAPVR